MFQCHVLSGSKPAFVLSIDTVISNHPCVITQDQQGRMKSLHTGLPGSGWPVGTHEGDWPQDPGIEKLFYAIFELITFNSRHFFQGIRGSVNTGWWALGFLQVTFS